LVALIHKAIFSLTSHFQLEVGEKIASWSTGRKVALQRGLCEMSEVESRPLRREWDSVLFAGPLPARSRLVPLFRSMRASPICRS